MPLFNGLNIPWILAMVFLNPFQGRKLLLLPLLLLTGSYISGWSGTQYVAKDDFKLRILLPPTLKCVNLSGFVPR